jgi:hypothetical protein
MEKRNILTGILFAVVLTTFSSSVHFVTAQPATDSDTVVTRDSVTLLLEGKSILPKGHIHLYDTGKFHIMDGHVAVKIPCNDKSEPLMELLGGLATSETFMKKLELHNVANMSQAGKTCMYHSDLGSVMGEEAWLLIDVALHNPSDQKVTFPEESVAIVSVNEIMKDPNVLPASEGDIPS